MIQVIQIVLVVPFLLSMVKSSYYPISPHYYNAVAPVSFVYPPFYPYYYDDIHNSAPAAVHSRVYKNHTGKYQDIFSRVCQIYNSCPKYPTCAPAPPPTTIYTNCNNIVGGVSSSSNGTIDLTNNPLSLSCIFGIGTLSPNNQITITCSDVAGGLIMYPSPTPTPSAGFLQPGKTYTVIWNSVFLIFATGGTNTPVCKWTASTY